MKKSGNKIVITGAGTGMGLAAAKIFHQNGNEVIMVARNGERLKAESEKLGNGAFYITCDLSDETQLKNLVENIREKHPDTNMAFLNAGVATNYNLLGEQDAFGVSKVEMSTNYHPVVFLTQYLEEIIEQNSDPIMIVTTSGVAFAPDLLHPTYSATKAALHNFLVGLRLVLERKSSAIKLFELMAPLVDSPFSKGVTSDLKVEPEEVINIMIKAIESDTYEIRPGLTEEIYQVYLKSPKEALKMVNAATGY